jgi:hypothetical protein
LRPSEGTDATTWNCPKTRFAEKSKIGIHQFYDARALNDPITKTASSIERTYPLRLAALEISPDETQTVQAAVAIVGATMSELQAAKRVELRGDMLSRNLMNIAFWLSFDLAGDRRKIGIASRSCVR